MPKKIKTLLLCKINPDRVAKDDQLNYSQAYKSIYSPPGARKFITIGSFDALCIYEPLREFTGEKWFYKLYEDKQDVISAMNDKISYHPIHLVANSEDGDDSEFIKKAKFCMATLVYGMNTSTKIEQEEGSEVSSYEQIIKQHLKKQKIDTKKIQYEIYNAINICDVVILWYTNELRLGLDTALTVSQSGIARKTFTITGIAMDEEGKIAEKTYKSLGDDKSVFPVRIQGSVRNLKIHNDLIGSILDSLGLKKRKGYQVYSTFGSEDFSLILPRLSRDGFEKLLRFLLEPENGDVMSKACWDIHTEILFDNPASPENQEEIKLEGNLSSLYPQLLSQFSNMDSSFYPWKSAFLELIGVQANIDCNPILFGPSHLLYDFIRIAAFYFSNDYYEVLRNSQETIESFIRNWSQLTDQTTRIDDLIFRGFGSTSAIYNTLPESAVDFLHAFLHKYVDVLIAFDANDGRTQENSVIYDFLLVPEMNQRMRICSMYDLSTLYQKNVEEMCSSCSERDKLADPATHRCWRNMLWPTKQAYLVEFPLKNVYRPFTFFAQQGHECFHFFGDAFRLREKRADYMALFLAAQFMQYLELGQDSKNKPLLKAFYQVICLKPEQMRCGIHLSDTMYALYQNLKMLFSYDQWERIYSDKDQILHYVGREKTMKKWAKARTDIEENDSGYWAQTIIDCGMFFKECFADIMMIASLHIYPEEYLALFTEELASSAKKTGDNAKCCRPSVAQRVAIVLATYCDWYGVPKGADGRECPARDCRWSVENCKATICNVENQIDEDARMIISNCFLALALKEPLPWNRNVYVAYVLGHVKDYLEEVLKNFENCLSKWSNCPVTKKPVEELGIIQKQFDEFFRQEKLFTRDYFSVIRSHHDYVRQCVKEKNTSSDDLDVKCPC